MKPAQTIYQVSELTDEMRRLMEASYPEIWIEGEVSSLSTPASGHLYFSLKDQKSQLRCAMFKGRASVSRYKPKAGDLVRVRAKISVYSARGDLQCIVQYVEEAGEGLLQKRFEELKRELDTQGLFNTKYKQEIPSFPKHIGVVTSPSGAAIKDVLTTLKRRCPGIPVTIYPAVVQGDTGAASIIQALRDATQHKAADIILLTRGGGSMEDLWCFNHDGLAKVIFDCPIPVISGVGHEVDITIADLVADARAATPTAAAEMVSPDTQHLLTSLNRITQRLPQAISRNLNQRSQTVDMLSKQLRHPKQALQTKRQRLDQTSQRLSKITLLELKFRESALKSVSKRFALVKPQSNIVDKRNRLSQFGNRLLLNQNKRLELKFTQYEGLANQLHSISPLRTLARGFSIARDSGGEIIRSAKETSVGSSVSLQLGEGSLQCEVSAISPSSND